MSQAAQLESGLISLGLDLSPVARDQLLAYAALLYKWNRTYSLTALREQERLRSTWVHPSRISDEEATRVLGKVSEREYSLHDLLRRPDVSYAGLMSMQVADTQVDVGLRDPLVVEQVEIQAKYQGYIDRQLDEVARTLGNEVLPLPETIAYDQIGGLSNEIVQKLKRQRPQTIGQASRIQGMTPAAIAILLVHLKRGGIDVMRRSA